MKQTLHKTLLRILPIIIISVTTTKVATAQDATSLLLTGASSAGGFAIGNALKVGAAGTAALAAGIPMLADWGYGIFKNKTDEDKIKFYISGRNYERWIQSQAVWYQSTLDPYTGRPQAFSGLKAMDDGMPTKVEDADREDKISKVYTVPIKMPSGTYDGVPYTERVAEFPKLP